MSVYRYKWTGESVDFIRDRVSTIVAPGLTLSAPIPEAMIDVTMGGGVDDKTDLDKVMTSLGWEYQSTDPPKPLGSKLTGSTPGLALNESVELLIDGTSPLILEDGEGYLIAISVAARGHILGLPVVATMLQNACVRKEAGVTTIVDQDGLAVLGDAAASTFWDIVLSNPGGPDRFAITFRNNATISDTDVVVNVTLLEILNP